MVQHILLTYADNQREIEEEEAFKATPLLFAARVKARRLRVRALARLREGRDRCAESRLCQRIHALFEQHVRPILFGMWLRAMRLCRRPLPCAALASWTVAQLRAEATLRGFDTSLCIERSEIEAMLSPPQLHRLDPGVASRNVELADDAV